MDALLGVLFDNWIEPADHVEAVGAFEAEPFEDRGHMRYRFRVRNDDGLHVFEQHAYFDVDDAGRISAMSTVCFGYRKRPED